MDNTITVRYKMHSAPGTYKPEWVGDADDCKGYYSGGFAGPIYDALLDFMEDKPHHTDFLVEAKITIREIPDSRATEDNEK
jgi:hypothetical protein